MEWVTCVMIVLIVIGAYLGWPAQTSYVDPDDIAGSVGGGHPSFSKMDIGYKPNDPPYGDDVAGAIGPAK